METIDTVISEVHEFSKEENCDIEGAVISLFDFHYPNDFTRITPTRVLDASLDENGDLNVVRKNQINKLERTVQIEHQSSTTLDLVGEQVWRGALFLADFIVHNHAIFRNANILEMASGVGLTSVIAGMVAKSVTITDVDKGDILSLIERNVKRNEEYISADVNIKELDFYDLRTVDDLDILKNNATIILVADVVYHNQLTDAFFDTVLYLMTSKPNKVIYIALEKRYVFTIEDMDTVAPCYEHFLSRLDWLMTQERSKIEWTCEEVEKFPQYFTYERTRHLVLWKIQATLI